MQIHRLDAQAALQSLRSSDDGLSADEAGRRLGEFGPNTVRPPRPVPWALRLARHFTHFFALILWLGALLAFIADTQAPGQGMRLLGLAIIGVILINGLFSWWQEHRTQRTLAALQRLLPHEVKVRRGGELLTLPATQLVPGDVLYLEAGDDIPADCRLIEAFSVRVNNATITGEALPRTRDTRPSTVATLIEASNVLLAGTSLVAGEARAVVFATGMHTEFGRIAHLTQSTPRGATPLQQEITRLSRWVALLSVTLGVVFFFIGQGLGLPFWQNLLFAIGIIVANVPEGLLPTLTLALAMGAQRMARRNALIRHLPSVETLGSTTVICTDKTGTLTRNHMQVRRLFLAGQRLEADDLRMPQNPAAMRRFCEIAAHCHNLKPQGGEHAGAWLGDPLEAALVRLAQEQDPELALLARVDELPFDSERRRMSTLHRGQDGLILYTKGALEALLPLCTRVHWNGAIEPLTAEQRAQFLAGEESLAHDGLRVIALAYRLLPEAEGGDVAALEAQLVLVGLAGFEDPPRPEVPGAIARCQSAGIRVIMVTGDHPRTALAIAGQVGLVRGNTPLIITGDQLLHFSDTELQLALDNREILFARIGADQKRRIVAALKRKHEVVAVTGDGVNDAPALREAHIGIAMGVSGTDVAREAADMVLLDDNFASIVAAVEEGRAVFDNIRKFLTYILTHNVAELVPYLAFALFRIPLPLTIIQILAIDLGTDTLPALALGAEPPDERVMQRPPRRLHERLVDFSLIGRAYLFLGIIEAAAAMSVFMLVLQQGGWRYGEALAATHPLYLQVTTACLSTIIVMQVVNVWLCRSERATVLASGLFSNPFLYWGIGAELALILLIDYTSWGNTLFGTAPIPAAWWLLMLPFAAGMLLLEELRKALVRRRS